MAADPLTFYMAIDQTVVFSMRREHLLKKLCRRNSIANYLCVDSNAKYCIFA